MKERTTDTSATTTGEHGSKPDWLLRALVELDVDQHFGLEVTLQMGGLLISGTLVTGMQFFAESGFREALATSAEEPEAAHYWLKQWAADVNRDDGERDAAYVHLKNARFSGECLEPKSKATGRWWRGRLSEVDGFTIGALR